MKIIPKFLMKQVEERIKTITGCEITSNPVKYLGINLTGQNGTLFTVIIELRKIQDQSKL